MDEIMKGVQTCKNTLIKKIEMNFQVVLKYTFINFIYFLF